MLGLRPQLLRPLKSRSDLVTLGAQGVVFDPDKRVLLVRHTFRDGWHFPGGGIEIREHAETALARELLEEAGIVVVDATLFSMYANFDYFPRDHIAVYVVKAWRHAAGFKRDREIAEQGFFALDRLPSATIRPVRQRLSEILDGRKRSARWQD
jgi:8-oxo-dGTP pyrophosphatase MutT (NUDIX family)